MRLQFGGWTELLFATGPKTRYPLLKAALRRVEQCEGLAGRCQCPHWEASNHEVFA